MAAPPENTADLMNQIQAAAAAGNNILEHPQQAHPVEMDLATINPDFKVDTVHYAVPFERATELGWKFKGARPTTTTGNNVDSACIIDDLHAFVRPFRLEGRYRFNNMPNFNLVVAYFHGGPQELASQLRRGRALHNSQIVGPLAASIRDAVDSEAFVTAVGAAEDENKDPMLLQKYMETIQTFVGKPLDQTHWMGMPMHISQFIRVVQAQVEINAENWNMPEETDAFKNVAAIDELGFKVRMANAKLKNGLGAPINDIRDIQKDLLRVQAGSRELVSLTWAQWCATARNPSLSQHIDELQSAKKLALEIEEETAPSIRPTSEPQQVIITQDGSSLKSPISPDDLCKLEKYLLDERTCDIKLEDARLLMNAPGAAIELMQPGGSDLSKIDMTPRMKDYISTMQMAMYKKGSCRWVPEMALLKLITLRFTEQDRFVLSHFGHILYEDKSDAPRTIMHLKGATRSLQVMKPFDHWWAKITYWPNLTDVMDGLGDAIEKLLHPSLISRNDIDSLRRELRSIYDDSQGRASVPDLKRILVHKLSERCRDLRSIAAGGTVELEPFNEFNPQKTSGVLYAAAKRSADFMAEVAKSRKSGYEDGETILGKRQFRPDGIDAMGREGSYKRKKQSPPVTTPEKPKQAPGGQPPGFNPRDANLRNQNMVCFRCGKKGHRALGCTGQICKIKQDWIDPARPHLKQLAEKIRQKAGVAIEYEKAK